MGDYSVSWNAAYSAVITSVNVGDPVLINDSGEYVLSTAAARLALGGRRTSGLARSAADSTNLTGDVQHNGLILAPSVPLLGAGTQSFIRVTSSGGLERAAAPAPGDDVIGIVDTFGNVMLTPNMAAAAFAGGTPGSPDGSVQFNDGGNFAGASNTAIDSATGLLLVGTQTGDVATYGDIRGASGGVDGNGFAIGVRNGAGDANILPLTVYNASGLDWTTFGGYGTATNAPHIEQHYARTSFAFQFPEVLTPQGGLPGFTFDIYNVAGPIGAWSHRSIWNIHRHTNVALWGSRNSLATPDDMLGGGEGVFGFGYADVNPTTNPTTAVVVYASAGDGEMHYRKADGTIRDMYGTAPGGSAKDLQYNDSGTAFGGVGAWTREASGRINVTTSGYISFGATGATYPSSGLLRLPPDDGNYQDLVVWHPVADDIPLTTVRYDSGSGITEYFSGGHHGDASKIVANHYLMGDQVIFENAKRIRFNLDSTIINQNGLLDMDLISEVSHNDNSSHVIWDSVSAGSQTTSDCTVDLEAIVIGFRVGSSEGAKYKLSATFLIAGGTITQIGSTTVLASHETDAAWTADLATDGTTIQVIAQGNTGDTVHWGGRVWIQVIQ